MSIAISRGQLDPLGSQEAEAATFHALRGSWTDVRRQARAGNSSSALDDWEGRLREEVLERLNSSFACSRSGGANPTQTCMCIR